MTTLPSRPHPALIVIDVQNGVVGNAHERDAVVANISTLVEKARGEAVSVIWVQHSDESLPTGTGVWEYVPELTRRESEPLVHKSYGDAFELTDFEDILSNAAIGHLIVTGAQTDACIRSTIYGAHVRGYDVTLVADAHTTEDLTEWGSPPPGEVIAYTNLFWQNEKAPGRTAAVVATKDVTFGR